MNDNIQGTTKLVIVICNVTGTQGRAICERFHQLQSRSTDGKGIHLRGLTRNKDSPKAQAFAKKYQGLLSLYSVDYRDPKTMQEPMENANALYLNGVMSKDEAQVYETILGVALQANMMHGASLKHIIYSSTVECQRRDHEVPHWETSWQTEQYISKLMATSECQDMTFHFVRFSHCNENLLTYFAPSKSGWIGYPCDPSTKLHTASVKDGARVACKLFLDPSLMHNGESVDVVAEYISPREMAAEISKVQERTVQAYKGPWILLYIVYYLFWEPWTIVLMGEFMEHHWTEDRMPHVNKIKVLLKDEIEEEPLETVAVFCERSFSKFQN